MVGRPTRRPDRTTVVNSGRRRRRACAGNTSGGELLATLAPTAGDDRPARAGAHPQPEAVGLRPPAVVRLERALAHEVLPLTTTTTVRPRWWASARTEHAAHPRRRGQTGRRRRRPQTRPSIAEETAAPAAGRIDVRPWSAPVDEDPRGGTPVTELGERGS